MIKLSKRLKIATAVLTAFAIFASVLPTVRDNVKADEVVNCPNPPQAPTWNPYNVYYGNGAAPVCDDFPIVQGKKVGGLYPNSASEHAAGYYAQPGEEIQVTVFYHNGAPDQDQFVMQGARANIQTETSSGTSHKINVTLSANNAASKSGQWKINTPSGYKLEIVPNSGKKVIVDAYTGVQVLESGLNLGNGTYNIGSLRGCFEYSAFLTYLVRVIPAGQGPSPEPIPNLKIEKLVRNVSFAGNFADFISAKVGETVEYKIKVSSTSGTLNNVKVTDSFPTQFLDYVQGTLKVNGQGGYSGLVNPGLTLNNITSSGTEITYQATILDNVGATIVNTAVASASGSVTVQDSARVYVNPRDHVTPNTTLSIRKDVRNFTDNGSFSDVASAKNGDTVEYKVTVKNTGSAVARDVKIRDNTPAGLSNYTVVSSTYTYGGSLSNTLNFADIQAGLEFTVVYRATVTNTTGTITNTATVSANNAPSVSDTATVNLQQVSQNTNLDITKDVRNFSDNTSFSDSTNADNGEQVEYRIVVRNTGNHTARNVRINDSNPSGLTNHTLISSTRNYSGSIFSGVNIGDLNAGSEFTIIYRANVNQSSGTIHNTASTSADNANSDSDSASVHVSQINQNTTLQITKDVRNFSDNTGFANSVNADNGEQVEYRIRVRNTGSVTANNVRVTDNATNNSGLSSVGTINSSRNYSGSLSGTLNFDGLTAGSEFEFTYRATINRDNVTIANTATAYADNANSVSDTAIVEVGDQKGNLVINKYVRKYNSGNSFAKSATVNDNDEVEYQIVVSVNSGRVDNVRLQENTISNFNLTSGSGRLDGSSINDSFYGGTLSLGTIHSGNSRTLTFRGYVRGNNSITNTATAYGDNVSSVSDSATVFFATTNRNLYINKVVKNLTSGTSYQNSVNANRGDIVAFEITVGNNSSDRIDNVRFTDNWSSGLILRNNFQVDGFNFGSQSGNSFEFNIGTLHSGNQKRIYAEFTVDASSGTLTNVARARGDNAGEVNDDAIVYVPTTGSNNLTFSKSAYNDTKGRDATTVNASRDDLITWTLQVKNETSSTRFGFVIEDDLSGVLPLADIVDNGGGTLSGNTIRFPSMDIAPGQTITKTFRVRVKSSLAPALTFTMINTYGNTVRVNIVTPGASGPITAPKTGVDGLTAAGFGGLVTAAYIALRKRKTILKTIFS